LDPTETAVHIGKQEEINNRLTIAVEAITDTMNVMAQDIKSINASQHKQEVFLEKLNNIESKIEDNNKLVHKRIDVIALDFKDKLEKTETRCKEEISELKIEHINPIKKSLDWAWKFIFTKLVGVVLALGAVIYQLVIAPS